MGMNYDDYLYKGTQRILEIIASENISVEERKALGEAFSEEIEMVAHADDGKWVVISKPTASSSGKRVTHCVTCGKEMQTETIELSLEEKNALRKAESYISFMPFSKKGLIEQLEYEGFSTEASTSVVEYLNVDWNEQAAKKAKSYIEFMAFSRSGLIEQLLYEGYTQKQAEYGVAAVGY